MKRNSFILAIIILVFSSPALLSQENKAGTCINVDGKDQPICIDFKNSWYYSVKFPTGWLIALRTVNSLAMPHIWNEGQYFISKEEMEKLKNALAAQGLAIVCPPPDYRTNEDKLKTREEICKKK